tara:strand:+ start:753 stop:1175 length:423 start_codon:yes stop_codon:yes gene_type:complete
MILKTMPNQRSQQTDDNLIPLINVVFLMLIFFMVAGHISASDGAVVSPPVSLNKHALEQSQKKVVIAQDGRVFIDGMPIDDDDISKVISSEVTTENADAVMVKADGMLDMKRLNAVLILLKKAGIEKITLVTQQQDGIHD